jgi:hypothetical protein
MLKKKDCIEFPVAAEELMRCVIWQIKEERSFSSPVRKQRDFFFFFYFFFFFFFFFFYFFFFFFLSFVVKGDVENCCSVVVRWLRTLPDRCGLLWNEYTGQLRGGGM